MIVPTARVRPVRPRAFTAFLSAVFLLLLSRGALAEDAIDLSWDAPPGCPRVAAVRDRLRALRGTKSRTKARLRAEGRIVRIEGRYRLTLGVHEGDAVLERKIEADSCKDLAGAAAVALALLLNDEDGSAEHSAEAPDGTGTRNGATAEPNSGQPETAVSGNGSDTSNTGDSSSRPAESPPNPTLPPSTEKRDAGTGGSDANEKPEERRPWRILARPLGTVDFGPLPRPAVGFGLGVGWSSAPWRVLVVGRNVLEQTVFSSSQLQDVQADVHRLMFELWACRTWQANIIEFGPCVVPAVERIKARGGGLGVKPAEVNTLGFALGAGVTTEVHVARWFALAANANLSVETKRPRWVLAGLGEVYQLGMVSLSLSLGAELSF